METLPERKLPEVCFIGRCVTCLDVNESQCVRACVSMCVCVEHFVGWSHRRQRMIICPHLHARTNPHTHKPTHPHPHTRRSNVGKSSLLNMVCNRKDLAYVSKRPGKTQQFNYFLVNDRCAGSRLGWFVIVVVLCRKGGVGGGVSKNAVAVQLLFDE